MNRLWKPGSGAWERMSHPLAPALLPALPATPSHSHRQLVLQGQSGIFLPGHGHSPGDCWAFFLTEGGATPYSVLPEGSHQAGPGCPGNHQRNIPLPGRGRGNPPREGEGGAAGRAAASAPSGGFNSPSKLGCQRRGRGSLGQELTPLGDPCLVRPLPAWVGWDLANMALCSDVCYYWAPTVCQVLGGVTYSPAGAEGLPCSSALRVHFLCWGWGSPGHVSRREPWAW